jgi:FAD/FMN-containing dehydrogenase
MPRAITTTNYYFPLAMSGEIGVWAGEAAHKLPKEVELTVFHMAAPPPLVDKCKPDNGYTCAISASAFVDTDRDAAEALAPVSGCRLANRALMKEENLPTPIDALLDMGAILFPEQHRYLADTVWTNSPPAEVLTTLSQHFRRAPSSKSLAPLVFSTGATRALPDVAYSMTANALLLCYAIWDRPEDDTKHAAWHREIIAAIDRFAVGHYVGESDVVRDPMRAERSFSTSAWQRLQSIRRKYDPANLFHGTSMPPPDRFVQRREFENSGTPSIRSIISAPSIAEMIPANISRRSVSTTNFWRGVTYTVWP